MYIQENVRLAPHTTLRIGGSAAYFAVARSVDDLRTSLEFARTKRIQAFILGGGSNVLFSDTGFAGLVIKMELKGLSCEESHDCLRVSAAAGEVWDDLVAQTVQWGAWGLENLSAIPGTVGAAPVQNIGAYGTEVMNRIQSVSTIDSLDGQERVFANSECAFSYRDSVFKMPEFRRYIITKVTFRLSKSPQPDLSYNDLSSYFAKRANATPSHADIRDAIIRIRAAKFPDLSRTGTAGSFWKNPVVSREHFDRLRRDYPNIPGFPLEGRIKVPLGWVLDHVCGLKGHSEGRVGLYKNQALVLVAEAGATGEEVGWLAERVKRMVKAKTGIDIESEVETVGCGLDERMTTSMLSSAHGTPDAAPPQSQAEWRNHETH